MKAFIVLLLTLISFSFSNRHHNSRDSNLDGQIHRDYKLCNKKNCPVTRGTCSSENICVCFDGYMTTFEQPTYCDYEQYELLIFLLLEFFFSFGVGHFYVHRYFYGLIKFIAVAILCAVYFIGFFRKKGRDAKRVRVFLMLLFTVWQLFDFIVIISRGFKDGNGKEIGSRYL